MNPAPARIGEIIGNIDHARAELPTPGATTLTLTIDGWLIHTIERIVDLYFETPGAMRCQYKPVQRNDLRALYPATPNIESAGYSLSIDFPSGTIPTPLPLKICATLESGLLVQSNTEILIQLPEPTKVEQSNEDKVDLASLGLRCFLNSSETLSFPSLREAFLSIIIVTHNRASDTFTCLQSLASQVNATTEIIIIDNNSTDATSLLLERVCGAKIVKNTANKHFLLAARQGARMATGQILLFLNNDTILLPGALNALKESFTDHPQLGVLGARLIHQNGVLQEVGGEILADGSARGIGVGENPQAILFLLQRSVDYCSGAFLATPQRIWNQLGGFDELFAPAYYEDVDYCLRVRAAGYQIIVEPRIAVIHKEGAVTDNQSQAKELMRKNQLTLVRKHQDYFKNYPPRERSPASCYPPSMAASERILFIDDFFPLETTGQGAPRSRLIIETLLDSGFKPTLVALNEPYSRAVSILGCETLALNRASSFLEFLALRGGSFGTIVISRPHNMVEFLKFKKQFPICADNCKVIYDAEAVFALREIRQRQVLENRSFAHSEIEYIVSTEILSVQHADQIWVTNEQEREEFLRRGIEKVNTLSYGTSCISRHAPFSERTGLLFVGPLTTEKSPNVEGISWFLKKVAPEIKTNYSQICHVGNQTIPLPAGASKIVFHGISDDLTQLYDSHRIFIAPIHFGAGIPLKVIEAAAHGIPIVTTPYIAEQLAWKDGECLLVAQTAQEFAAHIDTLYSDEVLWQKLRTNALEKVMESFSLLRFRESLLVLLGQIHSS